MKIENEHDIFKEIFSRNFPNVTNFLIILSYSDQNLQKILFFLLILSWTQVDPFFNLKPPKKSGKKMHVILHGSYI